MQLRFIILFVFILLYSLLFHYSHFLYSLPQTVFLCLYLSLYHFYISKMQLAKLDSVIRNWFHVFAFWRSQTNFKATTILIHYFHFTFSTRKSLSLLFFLSIFSYLQVIMQDICNEVTCIENCFTFISSGVWKFFILTVLSLYFFPESFILLYPVWNIATKLRSSKNHKARSCLQLINYIELMQNFGLNK